VLRGQTIFLNGFKLICVSRGCTKNISVFPKQNHLYNFCRPTREKGRIAIVTNAGWDAVDANSVRHA